MSTADALPTASALIKDGGYVNEMWFRAQLHNHKSCLLLRPNSKNGFG